MPLIALCAADRMEWCIAQANAHGTMFLVNSVVAFKLPGGDTALKHVIVHELVHCFLIATGDKSHDNPGAVKGTPEWKAWHDGMEAATDAALCDWKVDMSGYEEAIEWFKADAIARGFKIV